MAIATGLKGVAGIAAQVEKGNRQEDEFALKLAENREKNEAIKAYNDKNLWRLKYEEEVKRTHNPEDYLDALRDGERDYDSQMLEGKSEVFRDNFMQYDRIAQFNALGRMSTDMQRDIFKNYQSDVASTIDGMIATRDSDGLKQYESTLISDGFLTEEQAKANVEAGLNQIFIDSLNDMPPMERVAAFEQIKADGMERELGIDADAGIATALRENDMNEKVSAIRNSTEQSRMMDVLTPIYNDATKNRQDAIAALDSLGYEKDSALYISGMSAINRMYATGGGSSLTSAEKAQRHRLLNDDIEDIGSLIKEVKKGEMDNNTAISMLADASSRLDTRFQQMIVDGDIDQDKFGEIASLQEDILAQITGQTEGHSVASKVYDSIRAINIEGRGRVFDGPNNRRDEATYRAALHDALRSMSREEKYGRVDESRALNKLREIERYALSQVERLYGGTGTVDELADQYEEKNPQTQQIVQRTPEQNRANMYATIRSGAIPAPETREDAMQLVSAYLPGPATQDVVDAEVDKVMGMFPEREPYKIPLDYGVERTVKTAVNFVAKKIFGFSDDESDEFFDALAAQPAAPDIVSDNMSPVAQSVSDHIKSDLLSKPEFKTLVDFFDALQYQPSSAEIVDRWEVGVVKDIKQ